MTPQPQAETQEVTQYLLEVEFRSFNPLTGEKKSKPFKQYYTVEDWKALKVHGPNMGLFVNRVIEAPAGADTSYPNPGGGK